MRRRISMLLASCFLIYLFLPMNFVFAAMPIDRNGDGIHIDDVVYYVSQTESLSRSDIRDLLLQIAPIAVPTAPQNLVATAGDSTINLTWSSVNGASYYNVYQSTDDSIYDLISTPGTITSNTYEVTGLTNGTLYYFKVSAVKTVAESAYSNVVAATPIPTATAGEVAAEITSVTPPAADATSLTLPTVPAGFAIAIDSSSNTNVIGTNGTIAPPATATNVVLVFKLTRTSDNTTANTGIVTVTVPARTPTAEDVAAGITSVMAPTANATSLTLPTVPAGFTIVIESSSDTRVIGTNGAIAPPATATDVNLVFTVTRTSDNTTADTGTITVTVPARTPTAEEVAAGITSVTAPFADATSLTLPSVPSGFTIAIYSSSNTGVIETTGVIAPPATATSVDLVFTVTRISDGTTAITSTIAVTVPSGYIPELNPASRSTTNVALAANFAVATASSTYDSGFPISSINDGNRTAANWGGGDGWNDATADIYPDWVQIQFNGTKTINEIDVFTLQDGSRIEPTISTPSISYGIIDYAVQYWDGNNWVTVTNGNVVNNKYAWRQFTFSPVTTDKIRIWITNAKGYSRVIEVEAWIP